MREDVDRRCRRKVSDSERRL